MIDVHHFFCNLCSLCKPFIMKFSTTPKQFSIRHTKPIAPGTNPLIKEQTWVRIFPIKMNYVSPFYAIRCEFKVLLLYILDCQVARGLMRHEVLGHLHWLGQGWPFKRTVWNEQVFQWKALKMFITLSPTTTLSPCDLSL